MMPDLPNVDLERDIEQFIEFFENPAFRPDGLKLYPTLVIRGTGRGSIYFVRIKKNQINCWFHQNSSPIYFIWCLDVQFLTILLNIC